jgi:hypothetical protein
MSFCYSIFSHRRYHPESTCTTFPFFFSIASFPAFPFPHSPVVAFPAQLSLSLTPSLLQFLCNFPFPPFPRCCNSCSQHMNLTPAYILKMLQLYYYCTSTVLQLQFCHIHDTCDFHCCDSTDDGTNNHADTPPPRTFPR